MSDDPERMSAAEIRTTLRFLRAQHETANFENREAIARKIREFEAALDD